LELAYSKFMPLLDPRNPDAQVLIEFQDDPRTPGRTAYRITGRSRDEVAAEVTALQFGEDVVASEFEYSRPEGRWVALGYVRVGPMEIAK